MTELETALKQFLDLYIQEVAATATPAPIGRQNDRGARLVPFRADVKLHWKDVDTGDIYIADPKYLPEKLALRKYVVDDEGVITGEAHAVQKLKIDAGSIGAVIEGAGLLTGGGGAAAAVALLQQYLNRKAAK